MKKLIGIAVAMSALAVCANTPPAITNVRASQREGTKLVDIYYDAADADNDLLKVRIEISDNDGAKYSVPAFSLTGDIGEGIAPGTGKHIVWDAGTDWDGEYSDQMRVKVFAIDAQGFPGMEWGNEVPPGGFLMGQDGGAEGSGPSRHVNIPWSYWLGKYEVTAQQYCDFLNAAYAVGYVLQDGNTNVVASESMPIDYGCPVNVLLCNIGDNQLIRWSVNNFEVVGEGTNYPANVTWFGALVFSRFYGYDLPTEAEWEKAARGPNNDDQDEHLCFPWGDLCSSAYANAAYSSSSTKIQSLTEVGYYNGNQTPVGPDTINGFGLYDVIGNVAEWTRSLSENGISTYPNHETLSVNRQIVYLPGNRIIKGIGGSMMWYRIENNPEFVYCKTNSASRFFATGFRVARRNVNDDLKVSIITNTIENWAARSNNSAGYMTDENGLSWYLGYSMQCKNSTELACSGSKSLFSDGGGGYSGSAVLYSELYLPTGLDRIVEVRFRARNLSSSDGDFELYGGSVKSTYSYTASSSSCIKIPKVSQYKTYSIRPREDVPYNWIKFRSFYVDDIQILTIPRATGE